MRSALLLAALLAGAAAPGPARTRWDLLLDGERALVTLFPPLADIVDNFLHLATFTCDVVPLVPLLAGRVSVPPLEFVEYTARRTRRLTAEQAAVEAAGGAALYVGGWGNSPHDDTARALAAALLPAHPRVLVLDTRSAFIRPYVGAAARVPALAQRLSTWLLKAEARGAPLSQWHVVGFSLGAHVAARATSAVADSGRRVARLTALEPARPCARAARWRAAARLVTVLHTSHALALRPALGHADVYVALEAAGCGAACQHAAAWRLWAASARDAGVLRAAHCADTAALAARRCTGPAQVLGAHCVGRPQGLFLYQPPRNLSLHEMAVPLYPELAGPPAAPQPLSPPIL